METLPDKETTEAVLEDRAQNEDNVGKKVDDDNSSLEMDIQDNPNSDEGDNVS